MLTALRFSEVPLVPEGGLSVVSALCHRRMLPTRRMKKAKEDEADGVC